MANIDTKEDTNSSGTRQRFQMQTPVLAAHSWTRSEDNNSIIGFTATMSENRIVRSTVLTKANNATNVEIQQSDVVVILPFQNSFSLTSDNSIRQENITFIAYPDTRLIDASAASKHFSSVVFMSDPSQPDGWSQNEELFTGNGGMVQVYLSPPSPVLTQSVTIYFRPKYETTPENRHLLRCVFWNEKMNAGRGGWSVDGCWHEGTINGMEGCQCNHLSTFTLLVSRSEKYLQSTVHGAILNVITLIGSVLSIAGLSLILLTYVLFPSWRKPIGHKFLVQFSLALIALLITFNVGVDYTHNSNVCWAVAILLHYLLLANFTWMTIKAYHQYQRFVKVFGTYMPRFVLKSSLLAWGLPLLPIGAVLIYDLGSYTGDEGYCWLRPTVFYASVLGPIAALMLVNLCFFAFVVRSIFTSGRGLRTNQSESKQARDKLIACLFNFILLGLSWTFGFFAIGKSSSLFYSYLFCSTTTLQGFFIFFLYVLRDSRARHLWMKCFRFRKSAQYSQSSQPKSKSFSGSNNSESCVTNTITTGSTTNNTESDFVANMELTTAKRKHKPAHQRN